jgi:hypothetical protein
MQSLTGAICGGSQADQALGSPEPEIWQRKQLRDHTGLAGLGGAEDLTGGTDYGGNTVRSGPDDFTPHAFHKKDILAEFG